MSSAAGRRGRRAVPAAALGLALCLATGLGLAASFSAFLDRVAAREVTLTGHAEGAVALTGGADRVADAVALLAEGRADRLLITGVNPSTTAGEIVRRLPAARGLIGCCIALGYEAANTVGNAAETERWVRANHIRSLIVVTSNYHMPRALAEMGSALPGVALTPYPVVSERGRGRPWWSDEASARLMLWEWLKYSAATLRIGLSQAAPAGEPVADAGGTRAPGS